MHPFIILAIVVNVPPSFTHKVRDGRKINGRSYRKSMLPSMVCAWNNATLYTSSDPIIIITASSVRFQSAPQFITLSLSLVICPHETLFIYRLVHAAH